MNDPAEHPDSNTRSGARTTKRTSAVRAPKGKVLRLSDTLVASAEQHAAVARRSAPKQIEYWAQLGQLLESSLSVTDIHALLSGQKFVSSARLASCVAPGISTVLGELEGARQDGTLSASLGQAENVYDIADDGVTLRRTTADGHTELGAFVDGQFVAQ